MPGETLTIGTDRDNDIVADNGFISRFHARLIREGIRLYVEDLDSANHTYLNDLEVKGVQRIQPGDTIQLSRQWTLDWDDPAILRWLMPDPFRHRADNGNDGNPASPVFPPGAAARERNSRPAVESGSSRDAPRCGRVKASCSGPARKGCMTLLIAVLPPLVVAADLIVVHSFSLECLVLCSWWLP